MKNLKYFISIHMSKNTNIYTTCWVYIQTHSFKKYAKINTTWKKVSSRRCYPSMLHDHFIDLPPIYHLFWKKKYKVEKHHIYSTMTPIHTIIDSKKTHTPIILEDYTIKQRKIKLKFKENQKITWKLERKSLNWERVSPRRLCIKRDWNLREKI